MCPLRFGLTALLFTALGCYRPARPVREDVDVLVIAPHPDDEVLLAGGVMERALREGSRVAVVVLTNGDYTCARDGFVREAETVAALGAIGMREDDIHFLGYPDGYLSTLGSRPLPPVERRDAEGHCVRGSTTYAARGYRHLDEHTERTGVAAQYTAQAVADDLAALLTKLKPREVYLPHPIDEHPDHAATYMFFRRALDRMVSAPRQVHRGVVHAGPCYPAIDCTKYYLPQTPIAPLPKPLQTYAPREVLPVNAERKFEVISLYPSQTGRTPRVSWLASFARTDEVFYPEHLVREPSGRWVRAQAQGRPATELELDLTGGGSARLTAFRADGSDEFEVALTPDSVIIYRVVGQSLKRVDYWPRAQSTSAKVRLRVDPRPDDGEVSEWSIFAVEPAKPTGPGHSTSPQPDSFIGQTIVMTAYQRIEVSPRAP